MLIYAHICVSVLFLYHKINLSEVLPATERYVAL